MGSNDPFGHLKHKLWAKEGPGVQLAIWLSITTSRESPRFPCVQVVCDISLESSRRGLQLCFKLHLNWRFAHKLWAPKVVGILTMGISGLSFGVPETKWHLGASPVAKHKIYYKGEGGGFPQVRTVVSLVSSCLLVVRPCTKGLQLRINQLVIWFVQIYVSDWIAFQSSESHIGAPTCPSTHEVLRTKEHAPTPSLFVVFTFGLEVESIKELEGVSHAHLGLKDGNFLEKWSPPNINMLKKSSIHNGGRLPFLHRPISQQLKQRLCNKIYLKQRKAQVCIPSFPNNNTCNWNWSKNLAQHSIYLSACYYYCPTKMSKKVCKKH